MSATTVVYAKPVVATSSPRGLVRSVPSSYTVWLLVIAYVVLAKLLSITIMPITFQGAGQQSLLDWSNIGVFAVLGLVGAWCAQRTGFPDARDTRISSRKR